jgi:hypothetical protein
MENELYSLADVLAIANIHPFYAPDIEYPPDADAIHRAMARAVKQPTTEADLESRPLLQKKDL